MQCSISCIVGHVPEAFANPYTILIKLKQIKSWKNMTCKGKKVIQFYDDIQKGAHFTVSDMTFTHIM